MTTAARTTTGKPIGDTAIRLYGQPVLRRAALPVEAIHEGLIDVCDRLMVALRRTDAHAVAAPQIGVSRRLFAFRDANGAGRILLNPEIAESSGEWFYDEACLSFPGMMFGVKRPRDVLLRGVDLENTAIEIEATELAARVFQHEVDHLDGVLVIDRCSRQQRRDAEREMAKRNKAST